MAFPPMMIITSLLSLIHIVTPGLTPPVSGGSTTEPKGNSTNTIGCDKGWMKFKNNCYVMIIKYQNFRTAVDTCNQLNALPLMINSPDVQTFIEDHFLIHIVDDGVANLHWREKKAHKQLKLTTPKASINSVWLGGIRVNREATQESFRWINGQKLSYSLWKPGEPSNWTSTPFGMQFCLALDGSTDTMGKWMDVGCQMRFHVICQKAVSGVSSNSGNQLKSSPFTFEIKNMQWQIDSLKQQATDANMKRNILLGVMIILFAIAGIMIWAGDFSKKSSLLPNWRGMGGGEGGLPAAHQQQHHQNSSQPKEMTRQTASDTNGNNVAWMNVI